jgi:Phosphotransferase enzyme family
VGGPGRRPGGAGRRGPRPARRRLALAAPALRLAAEHGLPAPRLLAEDRAADPPVVLVERLAGSSAIPAERPPGRLRALGRAAAALHAVALTPGPDLPRRDRPIAGQGRPDLTREVLLWRRDQFLAAALGRLG